MDITKEITTNKETQHRYIDVKATKEKKEGMMHISQDQLKIMRKHRKHFSFFRIYNIGNPEETVYKIIKDPYKKIFGESEPTLSTIIHEIKIKI